MHTAHQAQGIAGGSAISNAASYAACARALSRCSGLLWRGDGFFLQHQALQLTSPHWQALELSQDQAPPLPDAHEQRARADALALRQRYHQSAIHTQQLGKLPADAPLAVLVFDWLEQLRVEARALPQWPGVARNVQSHFERWSQRCLASAAGQTELGLLLLTVAQMAWSRLNALALDETLADAIEAPRARLAPLLGGALALLRREREHQAAAAPALLDIARCVQEIAGPKQQQQAARWLAAQNNAPLPPGAGVLARWLRAAALGGEAGTTENGLVELVDSVSQPTYRVFNPRYDREQKPQANLRPALLQTLRQDLSQRARNASLSAPQLALRFKAVLALPEPQGWEFAQEQGRLDGRRLAQIVANPSERRVFRQPGLGLQTDCSISFLVDCSGSTQALMPALAPLLDLWVRALELAGAQTEVLGYTTLAWGGGRPQREWLAAGKPATPGRLNERCHLVFKSASESWRQARLGLATLMHKEMFREGLDGEALHWACQRARTLPARRRIVLMLSDGHPMERATQLANGDDYLQQHLTEVVEQQNRIGGLEIMGLGLGTGTALDEGQDLSRYFLRHTPLVPERALVRPWWPALQTLLQRPGKHHAHLA